MPMPYPETTNVGVLVNVQCRCCDNRPKTALWLAEVIRAGLLDREHDGRTQIEADKQNGVITIVISP